LNPIPQSRPSHGNPWSRRRFLRTALAAGSAAAFQGSAEPAPEGGWKAAVIGSTGHGDFGHGLEAIFRGVPGIAEVTLADPDPAGRRRAASSSGAVRTHADWKELLRIERPQLVSIASRHADGHAEIALACIEAGAHLYVEKPLVRDPAEADAVLQAAERRGRRVAVAHTMRMSPAAQAILATLRSGRIGELREMHAWGKQDHRSGGEDLMVLGSHLFDFFRLFAGDPLWVTARVLQKGRDIAPSDRRRVADDVGWVAGDRVSAQFVFSGDVTGTFTAIPRSAKPRENGEWNSSAAEALPG
jgi:predicted dehydrogenase